MKYLIFSLLTLIGLANWSCRGTKQNDEPRRDAAEVGFEIFKEGQSADIHTESRKLIQSTDDWEGLWKEVHAHVWPSPPCPEVDFGENMLLACFMGDRNSGGYSITMRELAFEKGKLTANLTYKTPGKNCVVTEMITQPFVILKLSRLDVVEAVFDVKEETYSCNDEGNEEVPAGKAINWSQLASGNYCGISSEQNRLVKSQGKWEGLWKETHSNVIPAPEIPEVDFSRQAVIACYMGDRSNGGYGLKILSMEKSEEDLLVKVQHTRPGKDCVVTMAITQPYEIVTVDLPLPQNVKFETVEQVLNCDR